MDYSVKHFEGVNRTTALHKCSPFLRCLSLSKSAFLKLALNSVVNTQTGGVFFEKSIMDHAVR